MTGWKDIDGSMVMAGSPGIIGSLGIRFEELLGSLPGQRDGTTLGGKSNLEEVERMLAHSDAGSELHQRVVAAAEMVVLAKWLLDFPQDSGTSLSQAQYMISEMRKRLPARYDERGAYWWREVDLWGNDGSPEKIADLRKRVAARASK